MATAVQAKDIIRQHFLASVRTMKYAMSIRKGSVSSPSANLVPTGLIDKEIFEIVSGALTTNHALYGTVHDIPGE